MGASPENMLLPAVSLDSLFKTDLSTRDKFLSRVFGIFAEEIVRIWCSEPWSPYEDLGRPTILDENETRGDTLDFTLRSKEDGRTFIGEQKCELEFESYRYLTLANVSQLTHHTGRAFQRFLAIAKDPAAFRVTVKGREITPSGAVLVWGCVSADAQEPVIAATGLHAVISLEMVIEELLARDTDAYKRLMNDRERWASEMFGVLAGRGRPITEPLA